MTHCRSRLLLAVIALGGMLLATLPAAAQQFFVETGQVPLHRAVQQEQRLGAVALPTRRTITFSDFQLGAPLRFVRPAGSLKPRPVVSYTFSVPDSVVRSIEVEIDSTNFLGLYAHDQQAYREPISRLPAFERLYSRLQQELITVLGQPLKSEALKQEENAEHGGYTQSDAWDTPTVSGQLYLVFSTKANPPYAHTYRIRARITYKNLAVAQAAIPALFQANQQQVAVCGRFLALLGAKQYAQSWELLGPEIKNNLSLTQYEAMLRPFVDPVADEQPLASLLMSGPLVTSTGQQLTQYTYLISGRKAPTTPFRINLLFANANSLLIAGLQPRYLSAPVLISK